MNLAVNDRNGRQVDLLRVLRSKEKTRAFYNKIGKAYDLLADRSEEPVRQIALYKLRLRHCSLPCCSRTRLGPGGKVYGIDLSDEMLRIAQVKLRHEGLAERVLLIRGDAVKLPYPSGFLDAHRHELYSGTIRYTGDC